MKLYTLYSKFIFRGKIKEAVKLQLDALPLINALFCEVNPIPIKATSDMLGYDF